MYQSNQARIKKEIPSLLPPAVGKGPRPALSRPPSSSAITGNNVLARYISFVRKGKTESALLSTRFHSKALFF